MLPVHYNNKVSFQMEESRNSIIQTDEEFDFAFGTATLIWFLELCLSGSESDRHLFRELVLTCRYETFWKLQEPDSIDTVTLLHDIGVGLLAMATYKNLTEEQSLKGFNVQVGDKILSNPKIGKVLFESCVDFQTLYLRARLYHMEIQKRFSHLSQSNPSQASFINMLAHDKELPASIENCLVHYTWRAQPKIPETSQVDSIYNEVSRMRMFVLSEKHTTEHENEKRSTLYQAITMVRNQQRKKMETNPIPYLFQLAEILNNFQLAEIDRDEAYNPLCYFPQRIKNQFLNLVSQPVRGGRHWSPPNPKNRKEMFWLDAPSSPDSDVSILEAGEHEALQSTSNPDIEALDGSVEDLLHEIENMDSRLGKEARIYLEAYMEGKGRPPQKDVAETMGITDRTLRNHRKELHVFLEKKMREK